MSATDQLLRRLTPVQQADLAKGLVRQIRIDASYIAPAMGSAFAAELRLMGLTAEADAVEKIVKTAAAWRPE